MEMLNKSTVHMKNREKVEGMISELRKGGAPKLQVIADFDHTLSRVHKNGKHCDSSYGIIDNSPLVSKEYKQQAEVSFAKYHPIEVDPHLTTEEKIPFMIEWYTLARDSFPKSGISMSSLVEMVATSSACLREDSNVVFETLNVHNVPVLIFSAGIGDVLKEVLRRDKLLLPNMKFIANHLRFDENNKVVGFKDKLIHTFNKSQSSIENHEYFEHLRFRNNIILLGDSLGDLDMGAGVKDVNVMLKIGFLNYKSLDVSGLGIHQKQPSYLPDYTGIFSLHALNFTPAAIDKTEKFLQVLSEDNALVSNVSFGALISTTTTEGRQYEFADQTTDRLRPETDATDYYNEVDSSYTKLDIDPGNTKLDIDPDNTKLDIDPGNTKLDLNIGNTKADTDYGNTNVDLDFSNSNVDRDSNNANLPEDSDDTNVNLEGNLQDSFKLEEEDLTTLPQIHVVTKIITSEEFQPSTTPEHSTVETTQTEDVETTTIAELTSTIAEVIRLVQSNSSDALLTDSEDGPVEADGKQPDIFDHLMVKIQSHWLDFVGKMKLSVLDVWKTISKHMMERMENFASAL